MTIFTAINLVIAIGFFGWHLADIGNMIVERLSGRKPVKSRLIANIIYCAFGLLWAVSAALFYGEVR